jgi:hypothetical protein
LGFLGLVVVFFLGFGVGCGFGSEVRCCRSYWVGLLLLSLFSLLGGGIMDASCKGLEEMDEEEEFEEVDEVEEVLEEVDVER